jgi:hypothetical protein
MCRTSYDWHIYVLFTKSLYMFLVNNKTGTVNTMTLSETISPGGTQDKGNTSHIAATKIYMKHIALRQLKLEPLLGYRKPRGVKSHRSREPKLVHCQDIGKNSFTFDCSAIEKKRKVSASSKREWKVSFHCHNTYVRANHSEINSTLHTCMTWIQQYPLDV